MRRRRWVVETRGAVNSKPNCKKVTLKTTDLDRISSDRWDKQIQQPKKRELLLRIIMSPRTIQLATIDLKSVTVSNC